MEIIDYIHINNKKYLLKIDIGKRNFIKYSIDKESYLKLPNFLSKEQKDRYIFEVKEKIRKYIIKNQEKIDSERYKLYKTGDTLSLIGKKYFLDVILNKGTKAKAELKENIIFLSFPERLPLEKQKMYFSKIINKLLIKEFKEIIEKKVNCLNNLYFNKEIKSISLKNNSSNYGSCSKENKISLSTSILTFPEEVIDYIIIHELAHTIEHNHSKRFWEIVERIIPDYKSKRKWIRDNYYKHRI